MRAVVPVPDDAGRVVALVSVGITFERISTRCGTASRGIGLAVAPRSLAGLPGRG